MHLTSQYKQNSEDASQPPSGEPNWKYTVSQDERDSCLICLKKLADILPPDRILSAHMAHHMEVIASLLNSDTHATNISMRNILKELHIDIRDRTVRNKAKVMPVLDRMIASMDVLLRINHSMELWNDDEPDENEGAGWEKMQRQVEEGLHDLMALAQLELRPVLTSRASKQQRLLESTGELNLAEYRPSTPFNQPGGSQDIDSDEERKEKIYVTR